MELKIIYEDENLLVIDKPPGITVFPEGKIKEKTLIDYLLERYSFLRETGSAPRWGVIHRLDKETSGILLIAKNNLSLNFFQRQFKEREVIKKYLALLVGELKKEGGVIKTLIGRSPKDRNKQKVYLPFEPGSQGKREAITEYKSLEKFNGYTLVEATPKTGRKHQIRAHFAYLNHPVAGDRLYGFKNQPKPLNLKRHFLHAFYLKIKLLNNKIIEFKSELTEDLKNVIKDL
jgi:23S rRNA pseudouridine1911/1915/1917 synthase